MTAKQMGNVESDSEEIERVTILDESGSPYDLSALHPISEPVTFPCWSVVALALVIGGMSALIGWQVRDASATKQIESVIHPAISVSTGTITVVEGTPASIEWEKRPVLAAPKDAPPAFIRVGKSYYTVHYTSAPALAYYNSLALTNEETREIWLNPERPLRLDLMHELMHCALAVGKTNDAHESWGYGEETFIKNASDQWLQILKDNRALLKWWLEDEEVR